MKQTIDTPDKILTAVSHIDNTLNIFMTLVIFVLAVWFVYFLCMCLFRIFNWYSN